MKIYVHKPQDATTITAGSLSLLMALEGLPVAVATSPKHARAIDAAWSTIPGWAA